MLDLDFGSLVRLMVDLFVLSAALLAITGICRGVKSLWRWYKSTLPLWYCMRYLNDAQKQILTQALVPFEVTFNGDNEESVVIGAAHLQKVKSLLHAQVVSFDEGNRVRELILRFPPQGDLPALRRHSITVRGRIRSQKSKLVSAVRDFILPVVRKNIVVHGEPGNQPVVRDNHFHIFLFAAPRNTRLLAQPPRLCHALTRPGSRAYETSGDGIPLVDETSGNVLGELVENCLYLHGDLWDDTYDRNLTWWQYFRGFFRWTRGNNPRLGLLIRVLQKIKEELHANKNLEELIAGLEKTNLPKDVHVVNPSRGQRAEVLNALLRDILLPVAGRDIRVNNCGGACHAPVASKVLNVFVNSSPAGVPILETPESVFGCRLSRRIKAFAPSTFGVPIADASGFIAAELMDGNLYLHCDFIQHGTRAEATLLAKLLIAVRNELAGLGSLTESAFAERLSRQLEEQCLRSCAVASVGATEAQVQAAQTDFGAQLTRTLAAQSDYLNVEEAPGEELGREFDALAKIPKVTGVDMKGSCLLVSTKKLYCTDPRTGKVHEIGAFIISIDSSNGLVLWNNQTRKVGAGNSGMNAPHVNSGGYACLGNMAEVFHALISQRNFAAAAEAAIAFVEAVNVNDLWGSYIHYWPVAENH